MRCVPEGSKGVARVADRRITGPAGRAMAVVWLGALMAFPARDGTAEQATDLRVDTLDGRVYVSNPDLATADRTGALTLTEELRIGAVTGDSSTDPAVFGDVIGLAVDDLGRIYVADGQWHEIRVFDSGGGFLRRFGRRGEGPGEFAELGGILWHPTGLWAMDRRARRLTVFDSLGNVLATAPHHDEVLNSRSWEPIVSSAGDLFEEDWGAPPWGPRIFKVEIRNLGVSVVDTLALAAVSPPTRTVESRGPGGLRGMQMVTAPSGARPRWSADWEGNIWFGNSGEFRLHKVNPAGDTVLTVELRRPPVALERRQLDSLSEATGFRVADLPKHRDVLGSINVARDGRIWILDPLWQRRPTVRVSTGWDVFSPDGYHLGRVEPPVPFLSFPRPVFGDGVITGVAQDELGIQYVVRLRVGEELRLRHP